MQIQEQNLLGRGQRLELEWESNPARESLTLSFADPHFLQSFTRLAVAYSDASDGSTKYFSLDRPFYALDTRWSAGTLLSDSDFNVDRWELGKRVGKFETHAQYYQLNGGWSAGLQDGWVRRWTYGATYQQSDFAPVPGAPLGGPLPADRKFVYPWVGFELVQDSFQERVNQDQIHRTEDVLVGFNGWARLGYATESVGSATDAVLASAYASDGKDLSPAQSVFGSAWASGRYEHGEIRNGILGAEARYYLRTSARSKFFANVSGTVTEQLDQDQQLTLGGDTGLRGYPFALPGGHGEGAADARAALLHQVVPVPPVPRRRRRVLSTWAARGAPTSPERRASECSRTSVSACRLGSSRSAFGNVVHIDLAFPLDGDDDIDRCSSSSRPRRSSSRQSTRCSAGLDCDPVDEQLEWPSLPVADHQAQRAHMGRVERRGSGDDASAEGRRKRRDRQACLVPFTGGWREAGLVLDPVESVVGANGELVRAPVAAAREARRRTLRPSSIGGARSVTDANPPEFSSDTTPRNRAIPGSACSNALRDMPPMTTSFTVIHCVTSASSSKSSSTARCGVAAPAAGIRESPPPGGWTRPRRAGRTRR